MKTLTAYGVIQAMAKRLGVCPIHKWKLPDEGNVVCTCEESSPVSDMFSTLHEAEKRWEERTGMKL